MIAVSIFIKQDGDRVSIASLSADDHASKALELMLCEQAANLVKYIDAQNAAMESLRSNVEKP